jgi:hypothetical protein
MSCSVDRLRICREVFEKKSGIGCDNISVVGLIVVFDSDNYRLFDSMTMTRHLILAFIFQGGWMGQG